MNKNSDSILVSIIMPTFNRSTTIGMAIESVLNQTYTDWELIIIDNESTDNTSEIINKYKVIDNRIKYHFHKKSDAPGIAEYLNYGIKISSGKYIARLDDDDEWCDKDKLNKQVKYFEKNQESIVVGGGAIMVDGNRKSIYKFFKRESDSRIKQNALLANPFWHNTVMFRKEYAQKVGGYKQLRFVEDWDLWLRLGHLGKFYNFQEHFSLYMNAGQNISTSNQTLAAKTILKLITEYKAEYPNFYKAYSLNYLQYLFSLMPSSFKNRTQNFLFYIKRNYF
jgi:glycosyltransferase involved in cell wall biosynthesis